jgi:hypothetical protein
MALIGLYMQRHTSYKFVCDKDDNSSEMGKRNEVSGYSELLSHVRWYLVLDIQQ